MATLGTPARRPVLLGAVGFAVLAALTLAWAKWLPYADRIAITERDGYPGSDILAEAGGAGDGPSLRGAVDFTVAYTEAVWPTLVAALLIAAAIGSLLPARWLLRVLGRDDLTGRVRGGLASLPSMMCTCCTAPLTRSLRSSGVPVGTALAYWLGNPLLNPAVLVFLAIVLPWEWVTVRALLGVVLVFGVTGLIARRLGPRADAPVALPETAEVAPRRFLPALARLSVVLIPEYLVVVALVGLVRGWLFPLDGAEDVVVLATLVAAVAGTLVVVPTGGEIPIIAALAAAGMPEAPLGALLVVLPAFSLPSAVMVGRSLTWPVTLAAGAAIAAAGVLSGVLVALL